MNSFKLTLVSSLLFVIVNIVASQSLYKLPFPVGTTYTCTQGNNGSTSHSNKDQYAFDFNFPSGSIVTAMRAGTVTAVVQSFANGNCQYNNGCNPNCVNDVNRVVIQHADGTWALYLHLTQNGAAVSVGQSVTQGQTIGYSGSSGCVTGAHLHVMLMNPSGCSNNWYCQSVPLSFCDFPTNGGVPVAGNSCTAASCSSSCQLTGITPSTISPGTGSAPGQTISTTTPTLTWNFVAGATNYGVYVRDMISNTLVVNQDCATSGTSYPIPFGILSNGGQYRWNIVATTGCGSSCVSSFASPIYFQVNSCSPPSNITSTGLLSACSGATTNITLSASDCGNGCTFNWSLGGGSSPTKNLSPGSYTVTVTNSCGATASTSLTISTLPAPLASATTALHTSCGNCNGSVSASGGVSYDWSGGLVSGQNKSNVCAGLYTVTVTNSNGCTASASTTVNSSSAISATASANPQTINQGSVSTLTATGGNQCQWSPTTGLSSPNSCNPTASPTVTTTYTVTVTNASNCTAVKSTTVEVNTPPNCSNSTATLSGALQNFSSSGGSGSFNVMFNPSSSGCTWSINQNNCSFINNLIPTSGQTASGQVSFNVQQNPDTTSRTCTLKISAGANTYDYVIQQLGSQAPSCNPPLTPPQVSLNGCNFVAQNVSGVTYQWYVGGNSVSGAISRFHTATATGFYYVVITDANSCTAQSNDFFADCGTIGISNVISDLIKIYPNPNNGTFTISGEVNSPTNISIKLCNSIGQVVHIEDFKANNSFGRQITTGKLVAGIYHLQLMVEDKPYIQKLIIQ